MPSTPSVPVLSAAGPRTPQLGAVKGSEDLCVVDIEQYLYLVPFVTSTDGTLLEIREREVLNHQENNRILA